ncbi:MAG: carboxypeptidase-like regulatory domain-containing protein [Actinomycetota bacterium]|nr:carboxypeptidase-like regulatory domain-containing protein [Actinomycetota bacterium]
MVLGGSRPHRGTLVTLVIVVVGMLSASAATTAQAATPPSISGTVTAADGTGPIDGLEVCAERQISKTSWQYDSCTRSAGGGAYTLPLNKGVFRLYADAPGLYGNWVRQQVGGGTGTPHTLAATTAKTVNISMVRGAKLSGYLHGVDGGPPSERFLWVEAYRVRADGTIPQSYDTFSNITYDGHFDVSELAAGTYKLRVSDHATPLVYGQQWFPDAAVASAATPLTVRTGQRLSGNDITLTSAGTLEITLTKPNKTPSAGNVEVFDADGQFINSEQPDAQGMVRVGGLHSGTYKVKASPSDVAHYQEWYTNKKTFATATPITVTSANVTAATLQFHYPTLKASKAPTLKIDSNLVASSKGTWNAKPSYIRYDWYRDGKLVEADYGDRYITHKADRGHRMRVCTTSYRDGYADGHSCSKETGKIK